MRRFSKFLMQACVCLFVATLTFAQTAHTSGEALLMASASEKIARPDVMPVAQINEQLVAAKRTLQTQDFSTSAVQLAAFNSTTGQMNVLSIDKDSFLTKGGDYQMVSNLGANLRVRIVRANGVNTAVIVSDAATRKALYPLMVRYPIEKAGTVQQAFYVSAHPALVTEELAASGKAYVSSMLNQASQSLAADGVHIPADLIEIASHLVIVEHTDHKRFREENREDISAEVLSLYALNRGDTYRYSVSSAGAGGMIQMIPKTYAAIRQQHPNVSLHSDFVRGMQDHTNALKAQLLYINDTWKFLQSQDEVQHALSSGTATKTELLAAGYNSNPYRLPGYLANGGSGWRSLIPAETQMYLSIYQAVDSHVEFDRGANLPESNDTLTVSPSASLAGEATATLISWVGNLLPRPSLPNISIR
ncbi:MAG TPA: hypothetical protein VFX97_02990 [Pyrinomonadaceae bacterium]|nr:hypothetical protein [Pyrinomonadaceae bacterium]